MPKNETTKLVVASVPEKYSTVFKIYIIIISSNFLVYYFTSFLVLLLVLS